MSTKFQRNAVNPVLRLAIVLLFACLPASGFGQTITTIYYFHTDHLNTPRAITNNAQQVMWRWDNVDPFGGNPPAESGVTCNLRLPGQYFDQETKLHYNYFRDYDPSIGRYIQSDPIGLAGGINTYAYVGSNPLNRIDPEGLQVQGAAVACGPYALFCACAITAVTWGIYSSQPLQSTSQSSAMHDPENRRQRQYVAAKDRCMSPDPQGEANCSELSKQIDMLQNSIDRYTFFDAKYTPGRHTETIENLKNRVKKLKDRYDKDCTTCK